MKAMFSALFARVLASVPGPEPELVAAAIASAGNDLYEAGGLLPEGGYTNGYSPINRPVSRQRQLEMNKDMNSRLSNPCGRSSALA